MKYQIVGYTFKKFIRTESCLYVARIIIADEIGLRLKFFASVKNKKGAWDYSIGHEELYDIFRVLLFRKGLKNITIYKLCKINCEKLMRKMLDNLVGFVVSDDAKVYLSPLFCGWSGKLLSGYNVSNIRDVLEEEPYDYAVLVKGFKNIPFDVKCGNPEDLKYFKRKINRTDFSEYECAMDNFNKRNNKTEFSEHECVANNSKINKDSFNECVMKNYDEKKNRNGLGMTGVDCFFFTSMVLPIFDLVNKDGNFGIRVSKPFYKLAKYVVKKYKLKLNLLKVECACEITTKRSKRVLAFYENKKIIKMCKNNFDTFELFALKSTDTENVKYKVTKGEIEELENPLLVVLVLAMMCDCCLDNGMYKVAITTKMYEDNEKLIELFAEGVKEISNIKFLIL